MTPDRFEIADQIKQLPEWEKAALLGWLMNHVNLKYRIEAVIEDALKLSRKKPERLRTTYTVTLEDLGL